MRKLILTAIITMILMLPLGVADNPRICSYPSRTGSPAVQVQTPSVVYSSYITPIREGLPVIVYGELPEGGTLEPKAENLLYVDEYGVLINYRTEPVILGTAGASFAQGYDWTRLYPWIRVGSYFSTNLHGFKASLAETQKLKDYGGRTFGVYAYPGFGLAKQVIKQWYSPTDQTQGKYIVPGVSALIQPDIRYVHAGIPSQPLPEGATIRGTPIQAPAQRPGATIKILPKPEETTTEETAGETAGTEKEIAAVEDDLTDLDKDLVIVE